MEELGFAGGAVGQCIDPFFKDSRNGELEKVHSEQGDNTEEQAISVFVIYGLQQPQNLFQRGFIFEGGGRFQCVLPV